MILVFGHNSPDRRAVGELLYLGNDGDEAQRAIDENADKFARIDRSLGGIEAFFRTVQHFDANHPSLKKTEEPAAEVTSEPKPKRRK